MDTLEKTDVDTFTDIGIFPYEESSNADHRTHIVNPPNNLHIWREGMTSSDIVVIARLNGMKVKALCGYTWVPKLNPDNYDACKTCVDIAGNIMREMGE